MINHIYLPLHTSIDYNQRKGKDMVSSVLGFELWIENVKLKYTQNSTTKLMLLSIDWCRKVETIQISIHQSQQL